MNPATLLGDYIIVKIIKRALMNIQINKVYQSDGIGEKSA